MIVSDLCFTPATTLAEAIRRREVSPVEITNAILERIDRLNPIVNAFCTLTPDIARQEARAAESAVMRGEALGPLHGIPYSIKDILSTKGIRTTRGSRLF